jgi:glycosyltransferase involved in cell wall biosynthesis
MGAAVGGLVSPRWTVLSPGDPDQRTGGYLYNARLVDALRAAGREVRVLVVQGSWPLGPIVDVPALPADGLLVADGLLWPALRPLVPVAALRRVVVVVHSVLSAEGGSELIELERRALAGVGGVVATGGPTQRDLAAMGIPSLRIEPGTDPAPRATGRGEGRLLALGTVTPRKGLLRLLEALETVHAPWTLDIVGSATRDPAYAARVRGRALALGDRVRLHGELGAAGVAAALAQSDLLVHAAHYEAYGMALAEALARGVPVLCTPAGAVEDGGAVVVPPEDLASALQRLLSDPVALRAAAEAALRRGRCLPTWSDVARRFLALEPELGVT